MEKVSDMFLFHIYHMKMNYTFIYVYKLIKLNADKNVHQVLDSILNMAVFLL